MKTNIHPALAGLPEITEADSILRKCVHCGFCTATCPTYQLTGDELDGPRGRIYLIKNLLEENTISDASLRHLDRCLTCRACETTCPSGVDYGRLLDIGRAQSKGKASRPLRQRVLAFWLRQVIPVRWLFRPLLRLGQLVRPLLPADIRQQVPAGTAMVKRIQTEPAGADGADKVLLLSGCVQSAATPGVVAALANILERQGKPVEVIEEGCCGALDYHLSAHDKATARMRHVIDLVSERLEQGGVEAVVSSATGCAVTIAEYPLALQHDAVYRDKARAVVGKLADPVQLLANLQLDGGDKRVAVHVPCSMQHGMKLGRTLEDLFRGWGFAVTLQREGHLCCGSAGTYSILEPGMSARLRTRKIADLTSDAPDVIVTANIGCQLQLAGDVPVMHWLEFIEKEIANGETG